MIDSSPCAVCCRDYGYLGTGQGSQTLLNKVVVSATTPGRRSASTPFGAAFDDAVENQAFQRDRDRDQT